MQVYETIGSLPVVFLYSVCYAKRRIRDAEAREAYKRELENEDMNGIYLRDIIREEMRADDARLR